MITRRNFLQVAAATAAITGLGAGGGLRRAAAQQSIRQEDLLRFDAKGQLKHFDIVVANPPSASATPAASSPT